MQETRRCKECRRVFELNEESFRKSKGYYLRICRKCENKKKRQARLLDVRGGKRKIRTLLVSPYRPTVEALIKKYSMVFRVLDKYEIDYKNLTADQVDVFLESRGIAVYVDF
ncbi:hypothetical protein KAR91_14140 [Candidatus Pacearchaeota archaeon]|nr:hypothetical protein [Candidatus Pacearchaeota archaeon]